VTQEPITRELGYTLQCSGLFEQMGCAWHDLQRLGRVDQSKLSAIELDDDVIVAAYYEERWGPNARKHPCSKVGPSSPRNYRRYRHRTFYIGD
jgi:hypothetical protein